MWRYYSYDVWGNAEDGYDVNDVFRTDTTVDLPRDASFRDLARAFDVTEGIVDVAALDTEDTYYLERERDGKPMGEFRFDAEGDQPRTRNYDEGPLTPFFVDPHPRGGRRK